MYPPAKWIDQTSSNASAYCEATGIHCLIPVVVWRGDLQFWQLWLEVAGFPMVTLLEPWVKCGMPDFRRCHE